MFLRTTLMQIFKKIGKTVKEPLYFKGRYFLNPVQNPVFLPDFYSNFSYDGRPSNVSSAIFLLLVEQVPTTKYYWVFWKDKEKIHSLVIAALLLLFAIHIFDGVNWLLSDDKVTWFDGLHTLQVCLCFWTPELLSDWNSTIA